MISFSCCPHCSKSLWDYGSVAFFTFEEICISHIQNENFDIPCESNSTRYVVEKSMLVYEAIKFLEMKGYILTTESSEDYIRVKPNGLKCQKTSWGLSCYYCKTEDNHSNV